MRYLLQLNLYCGICFDINSRRIATNLSLNQILNKSHGMKEIVLRMKIQY
ncbi:unnamed protein product [Paramecium sonneborni]|uniref:Uncharacterized protein n=1 Tax=Paramecium sonneborni TaxID=65129 RepID=A0A8S1QPV7_9CILI|nr:unnamed protein product [Paramecium sonneborni]